VRLRSGAGIGMALPCEGSGSNDACRL